MVLSPLKHYRRATREEQYIQIHLLSHLKIGSRDMNFEIANAWIFVLVPLPILLLWILPALKKRRTALLNPSYFELSGVEGVVPKKAAWISKRNWFNWLVVVLVWLSILGALSSPQLVGEPKMKIKTARSFLIAADISFSMDIKDWKIDGERVSRWEAIKVLMKDFVQTRKSDQIGLIFFGTNAYLQAPLTTDLEIIEWMLEETEVGMAGQMTGIGNAIGMAMKVFEKDTIEEKVLFLLTDGVDSGSEITPLDAAGLAKQDSVTIYTLGIGDPSGTNSDLDERTLKEIASITGGKYFQAMDERQVKAVYDEINKLKPLEYEEESYVPTVLLYYYPLAFGLALVIVWSVVRGLFETGLKLVNYSRQE